ncbi:unnamed protein product [Urochloa decumbens]|uniref:Zinc-ribbon domain-containing protein n=1 Tax=Urochloa decumbens TaxID=240449 RepID=A0ABC9C7L5_9POAL
MEPHKLRFVRCPRCNQLLVEYPSIPVYKCGGCGTVLRAKNRAVPAAQAGSGSDQQNSFPSSLQGSPQSSKSICSDEQKAVPSVDQPRAATTDGSISSTIDNIDSCKGAIPKRAMSAQDTVTRDGHLNEEAGSLVDGNMQNSEEDMVKEIHDKDSRADTSSNFTEKLGNLDTTENPNGGKVDGFATTDVSTLNGNTEVVHMVERLQSYEGMHVESHEALIEELERSLSFSSDDEYFSDEAENIGLSDALRKQMGSRRFMLGVKVNDASRSDPHGRLIEELEMSFSDAEEPMEQHAVVVERVHGNVHDMHPQNLGAESAHPCEESLSSFDDGHLKYEETSHQETRLIGNDDKVKEECNTEESSTANYAAENIAGSSHESGKDWQSIDVEIADPCEESVSLSIDSNIKDNSNDAMEECRTEDDSTANCVNGNAHILIADEDIVEVSHENGKAQQFTDAESAHPFERNVSSADDGNEKSKQSFEQNELISDVTQETEEGCMEDDNTDNNVHDIENMVFPVEEISDRQKPCCDEGLMTACRTGENEDGHVVDDIMASTGDANEIVAVADDHIAERVDNNEALLHSRDMANTAAKDRQSLEAEGTHLDEEVFSSLKTGHIKSEQSLQQNELISDGTKEKEEADMEDRNASATVASFSSLPYKRTQHKVPSFNKKKEEISYGYKASQLRQGLSLDSEDFKSIQNFIELQIDGTSSSRSSGSPSQGVLVNRTPQVLVRHERLKKMDELRDQLSRLSSQKGSEKSFQKRDPEHQQQSNNYDLQSIDGDSIRSSCALESYYGRGRPPRYQPSNSFSPTHTYTNCHFGHAQTHIPHNYDPWEFNSYYQSSYAESTNLDYESLRSNYKEPKRVVRKHILRPVSGASPYTICNSCFNLVQMPSDIYVSKAKIGKMQCGKCSKVLALSFPSVHRADAKNSVDVAQQSYNPDDSTIPTNEDITSYYAECLTGGPVSTSEDYGALYTRSLPTQAGSSSLAATQSGKKVSDSALHRLMGYDSASQLLRHSRVFDDGYESFESMVPVSSRLSRRKNK